METSSSVCQFQYVAAISRLLLGTLMDEGCGFSSLLCNILTLVFLSSCRKMTSSTSHSLSASRLPLGNIEWEREKERFHITAWFQNTRSISMLSSPLHLLCVDILFLQLNSTRRFSSPRWNLALVPPTYCTMLMHAHDAGWAPCSKYWEIYDRSNLLDSCWKLGTDRFPSLFLRLLTRIHRQSYTHSPSTKDSPLIIAQISLSYRYAVVYMDMAALMSRGSICSCHMATWP